MTFKLTSSVFGRNEAIPMATRAMVKELPHRSKWTGAPAGTKSFALIVDDPDAPDPKAPKRIYVHWVAYDIPGTDRHSTVNTVKVRTTNESAAIAVPVRRWAGIATSSSSTRSIRSSANLASREKQISNER